MRYLPIESFVSSFCILKNFRLGIRSLRSLGFQDDITLLDKHDEIIPPSDASIPALRMDTVFRSHSAIERKPPKILRKPATEVDIRVNKTTESNQLGGAIAARLRSHDSCEVLTSGDEAVARFLKGVAMARMFIQQRSEGDLKFQPHHCFW